MEAFVLLLTGNLLHDAGLTVLYSLLGIAIAVLGYKIVDWLIPGHIGKQIAEDRNMAIALVTAAMILGVCIIIAASISS